MNLKKIIFTLLAGTVLTVSCSRDDDPKPTPPPTPPTPPVAVTPDPINDFIWKAMNSWYYWQDKVPALADNAYKTPTDYANFINGKTPDKLFYNHLLFEYGKTDEFSWIENNNEIVRSTTGKNAEIEKLSGLEIALFPKGGGSSNYVALVTYVVKGSTAETAGIKRGDVITKVNGAHLTGSNYSALFGDSFSVSRAETANVTYSTTSGYTVTTTDKEESIAISKSSIEENPIAHYQVFEMGGKKIGYLVFNGFKIDYNDELNEQFAKMQADGVNELILDMRYNGGGSLSTAIGLAQMINGNIADQTSQTSPYIRLDFNSKHRDYNEVVRKTINYYTVTDGNPKVSQANVPINSLTLPKVHILISFQSASATELTVYSLSKFMNVETYGYLTVGKFVGSHTLYDSPNADPEEAWTDYDKRNKAHNWKMQPITFAYYNRDNDPHPKVTFSDGSTAYGIVPPTANRVHPYEWIGTIKEFGVTTDPELKLALEKISGTKVSGKRAVSEFRDTRQKVIFKKTNAADGLYIHDLSEMKRMSK